ncbi:hypothetical protein FRX31_010114 [Thalictrum thalictroides]|uniref:Uncharacterized protein n=1 Tax=Thalictrum thalictroides TaxID=46969 RepID=A0A7J6WUJ9_THATH|nr:hypothetical protein FRX31_010114 [Thalictrum thalictroides]
MILDGKKNSDGGRSEVIEGASKLGNPNLFENRSSGNSSLNLVRTQTTLNKEDDETEPEGIEELITARFGEGSVERFMRLKADINKLSKQVEVQSEALSQVVRVPDSYGNPNSANEVMMEETQQHEDVLIVDDETREEEKNENESEGKNEEEEVWQSPKRRHTCHKGGVEAGTSIVVVGGSGQGDVIQSLSIDTARQRQASPTVRNVASPKKGQPGGTHSKGAYTQNGGGSNKQSVGASTLTLNSKKVIK